MSHRRLRRTIRRCTALLLVVLGAIAIEVASVEYPDGGYVVGGGAVVGAAVYLLGSGFAGVFTPGEDRTNPDAE